MELHKALHNIIQTNGPDILKEVRLVNILDDFNAYQDIQGSKYILRAIIEEGFATRFYQIGSFNNDATNLVHRFVGITGFSEASVIRIFNSLAFGLGWTNDIEPFLSENNNAAANSNYYQNFKELSLIEQEDLITDLIEIDPIFEDNYAILIKASASITKPTLYLNIELNGNLSQNSINIHAVLYNKKGLMKDVKSICTLGSSIQTSIARFKIFFDGVLIIKEGKSFIDYKCIDHNVGKIFITSNSTNNPQAYNFEVIL